MDGQRFDAESRVLGARMSRGRALGLLAGVAALRGGLASAKDTTQRATLYLDTNHQLGCHGNGTTPSDHPWLRGLSPGQTQGQRRHLAARCAAEHHV
jgi:hypothetical protein